MSRSFFAMLTTFLTLVPALTTQGAEVCPNNMIWDSNHFEETWSCESAGQETFTTTHSECSLDFGSTVVLYDRSARWDDVIVAGDGFALVSSGGGDREGCGITGRMVLNTLYSIEGPASTSTTITVRVQAEVEVSETYYGPGGIATATLSAFGEQTSLHLDTAGQATELLELTAIVDAGSSFTMSLAPFAQAYSGGGSTSVLNVVEILLDPGFELEMCQECGSVSTPAASWSSLKARW